MALRLYVDFNTMMMDEKGRIPIPLDDSIPFNESILADLQPGSAIVLYDEDFEVEATLEFDQAMKIWMAAPHWATRKDL